MKFTSFAIDNETGETIFKPKYDNRMFLVSFIMPIFFLLSLGSYYNEIKKDFIVIFSLIIFGIGTLLVPFIFIKEIRFGKQMIVKYFLIRRHINYGDITGINRMAIRLKGRGVSLAPLDNTKDLIDAFPELIANKNA